MSGVGDWAILLMILLILCAGLRAGKPLFSLFAEGAAEGLHICLQIFPYVLGMMMAVAVFRASDALDLLGRLLTPVLDLLHIPVQVLPLALLRPLSGSGALGITGEIITDCGPDSAAGLLASVMQGSTETTFYVLAVYFGAAGVKKYRYAPLLGLSADLVSFLSAAFFCGLFFGS